MRVAMLSYHTCPLASLEGKETGGMNVYVLQLSKALGMLGVTVDMFTRSQDAKQPKEVQITSGVRLFHLKAGPEKPVAKKKLAGFVAEFIQSYRANVSSRGVSYDVLHGHYYLSGLAGLSIRRQRTRTPLIMTFHTLGLMKNLVARDRSELEERERIDAEYRLIGESERIVATSRYDQSYLEYLYGCPREKITVGIPGVDAALFRPIEKRKARTAIGVGLRRKVILFVGRIEPVKGVDVLLYAIKILQKRNPRLSRHVSLWIVGGDVSQKTQLWSREMKKLNEITRLLRITADVRFVGQKPQNELVYYYNAADVLVIPSHYESFGMAAAEAMACGVPVIATNVTGISGIMEEDEELIASANNPLKLARQLESLLTDRSLHERLSRSVREKAKSLRWEDTARSVVSVYRMLSTSE
jgi:D-inositol-3-phosphate glycosyltransferase